MNLPHQVPLIFAKNLVSIKEKEAIIYCDFSQIPSLSMFGEASAQASSVFDTNENNNVKIGFVTMFKSLNLLNEISNQKYLIKIIKNNEINTLKQFSFEAFDNDTNIKIVTGSFTLVVPNVS